MIDRNLFLALGLSLAVLTLWSYVQEPPPALPPATEQGAQSHVPPPGIAGELPSAGRGDKPSSPAFVAPPSTAPATAETPEQTLEIENDLYAATLSTRGGELRRFALKQFVEADGKGKPSVIMTTGEAGDPAALSTPLTELKRGDWSQGSWDISRPAPDTVVFTRTREGVSVRKTYLFDPSSYVVTLRVQVSNASQESVDPTFEVSWPERATTHLDFTDYALVALQDGSLQKQLLTDVGSAGFFGSLVSSGPPTDPVYAGGVEWAGAESRYFLAAMIPDLPREATARFVTLATGQVAKTALSYNPVSIPPGQSVEREVRVFIGPKEAPLLEAAGANLDRSIDLGYSWMAPLTKLFVWLLRALYAVIPNYGVAIILLTVLVRVVTAPLTQRQMNSMKRMQALQPRIKAMQEKYADDKSKQSEEMMKLYKESGVNPLGGCLPILLQMPVFIGLYYALQSSIELRQAPFFGWINDLSAPETLFTIPGIDLPIRLLPLIMGGSMVLQQKLSPQPSMDPAQQRMMLIIMPVMFTVLFYQFPSGLVLYWLVSNLLASAHQYWITRTPVEVVPDPVPVGRERSKR